jgi:hypothetical protein
MKLYSATYVDLDGVLHTLPWQSKQQIDCAYDHIVNLCEIDKDSWVNRVSNVDDIENYKEC